MIIKVFIENIKTNFSNFLSVCVGGGGDILWVGVRVIFMSLIINNGKTYLNFGDKNGEVWILCPEMASIQMPNALNQICASKPKLPKFVLHLN
jgi:hypothetical protein